MRKRLPSAAQALFALTAIGLVLSGCYYRPYYGEPHYASPGHGYKHHYHGEGWRHGDGHRYYRHGGRGHY